MSRQMRYRQDPVTGDLVITPREGLLARTEPTRGRVGALNDLRLHLALATEIYDNHGDGGRAGIYKALLALTDYLTSVGIPYATLSPLMGTMAALVDADRGVENPAFKPRRTAGRQPRTVAANEFEQQLAVVSECCVRYLRAKGERPYQQEAAKLAAKLVNDSPLGVTVTPTRMREIRERVRNEPIGSSQRNLYDILTDSSWVSDQPLLWAKVLVTHHWVSAPPQLSG